MSNSDQLLTKTADYSDMLERSRISMLLSKRIALPVLFLLSMPIWGITRVTEFTRWVRNPWDIGYYGQILGTIAAPTGFFPWYYDQSASLGFVSRGDVLGEWKPSDPAEAKYTHIPPYEPGMTFPLRLARRLFNAPLSVGSFVGCQLAADLIVLALLGLIGFEIGGVLAAALGILIYAGWREAAYAAAFPFYYYWPQFFNISLLGLLTLLLRFRTGPYRWLICFGAGLTVGAWCWFRGTGEGQLVLAPLLVVFLFSRKKQLLASFALVIIGFTLVLAPAAIHNLPRNHSIFPRGQVWHDLYVGIGTRNNPYGITHSDSCAALVVKQKYGIGYQMPGYEEALRSEYLSIVRANPGLIARNFFLNFTDSIRGWSFTDNSLISHRLFWIGTLMGIGALLLTRRPQWRLLTAGLAIWAVQCATLSIVNRPQSAYLWETMSISVLCGAGGFGALFTMGWNKLRSTVLKGLTQGTTESAENRIA